jgi:hypothetical protein
MDLLMYAGARFCVISPHFGCVSRRRPSSVSGILSLHELLKRAAASHWFPWLPYSTISSGAFGFGRQKPSHSLESKLTQLFSNVQGIFLGIVLIEFHEKGILSMEGE